MSTPSTTMRYEGLTVKLEESIMGSAAKAEEAQTGLGLATTSRCAQTTVSAVPRDLIIDSV